MCRSVADAAVLLAAIAAPDPLDPITLSQPHPAPDFIQALRIDALHGARIGVPRKFQGKDASMLAAFDVAISTFRKLGAVVVDPAEYPEPEVMLKAKDSEHLVMCTDLKVGCLIHMYQNRQNKPSHRWTWPNTWRNS
jgi:amidase